MKTLMKLTLVLAFLGTTFASAQDTPKKAELKIKTSAVCDMCKKTLEKTMAYEKGVLLYLGLNYGKGFDKLHWQYTKAIGIEANPDLYAMLQKRYRYNKHIQLVVITKEAFRRLDPEEVKSIRAALTK